MKLLDWIRTQTPTMKGNIAFGGACMITGVIALVWMTTLPPRFGAVSKTLTQTAPDQVAGAAKSLDTLIDSVTEQGSVKNNEAEGEETAEGVPPSPQPSMGALRTLADWQSTSTASQSTTTYPLIRETDPPEYVPESPHVSPQPPQPEPQVAPVAEVPTPPPSPQQRVILIGTTTNAVPSNE